MQCFTISGNDVLTGTGSGIFKSIDNGAYWTFLGLRNQLVTSMVVNGSNIFASTWNGGGVFISTNNRDNWSAVNNGLPNMFVNALAMSANNLFAGLISVGQDSGGVFLFPQTMAAAGKP